MRYLAKPLRTKFWKPGDNHIEAIVNSINRHIEDGDTVIVSEKAICTAMGRVVNESKVNPKFTSKIIAFFWMRFIWGYFLGVLCRLSWRNIVRLRNYPTLEGAKHKQLTLSYAGLTQTLRHGSEGGIDVSNLPYAYACLPLRNAVAEADKIRDAIREKCRREVAVMIVDSDKTYTFRGFHITPRPNPIRGIMSLGLPAYVLARMLRWRPRSTPLAVVGRKLTVEEALNMAAVANKVRGYGAGRTAWDVAEQFGVGVTEVTWQMLEKVKHLPIVVVRRISRKV